MSLDAPDILFLQGDIIGHKINQEKDSDEYDPYLYEQLLKLHKDMIENIKVTLPETIVIPVFGNNDFKYHY
jgi:hypothetical protein